MTTNTTETITLDTGETERWDSIHECLCDWADETPMPAVFVDPKSTRTCGEAWHDDHCIHEIEVMCPRGLDFSSLPDREFHLGAVWSSDKHGVRFPIEVYFTMVALLDRQGTQGVRWKVRYA